MKPPPLLLGATLLFWGWQTDSLTISALMAVVLEGARWSRARWEFADDDLSRVWAFCTVLFLGAAIYAFTANEGPADFRGFFQNPSFATERNVGAASAKTAASLVRWLPMIFFLLVAAQAYSAREGIPLETISFVLRRRRRKARRLGQNVPPSPIINVAYPYFGLCLLSASSQTRDDGEFFWGVCILLAWPLCAVRPVRFRIGVWAAAMIAAVALGYTAERSVVQLQKYVDGLSAQWLGRFGRKDADPSRSHTAIGQIGRIKASGKIVVRLQPLNGNAPPALLREASYRIYRSQTWYAGTTRGDLENILPETNKESWLLVPGKTTAAAVNIASYLHGGEGLLPLPEGSSRLDHLPAFILQKNTTGAVLAQGPGLVMFDARYGPGETIDSPQGFSDLTPSVREEPALNRIISELHLQKPTLAEARRALADFFQNKFAYSMWQGLDALANTNETALSRFLLHTRRGHCEYFATATVLLMRKLGFPARYAVGYSVHEASGKGYVVRQRDGHAWCLVWNDATRGWEDFDTTPPSWVDDEAERASALQWLGDVWSRLGFEFSKFRWGQTHLRHYFLWGLAPVLLLLFYQIIARSRRAQRKQDAASGTKSVWPGLDSEFYQVEKKLMQRGLPRAPGEPLSAWLQRALDDPHVGDLRIPLQKLLRLHYRYRFDPLGLDEAERDSLRITSRECVSRMGG